MNRFIALQHTYEEIQIGLFEENNMLQMATDTKKRASKTIVALVEKLLQANDTSFDNLLFVAANQGPGPFTTLRVVIASANGLAFATKKPMIGIDGLDALLDEHYDKTVNTSVALLNAYSGDVYFGIETENKTNRRKGYQNIASLLTDLKSEFTQPIRFIGQAVDLYKKEIQKDFGAQAVISNNLPHHCSIEQIGLMAWNSWQRQEKLTKQLLPLYLKSVTVHKKTPGVR